MIRHLQRSADFERVLRTRSRASSLHFAVHHLAGAPMQRRSASPAAELSTAAPVVVAVSVDGMPATIAGETSPGVWWGAVVPKRHARRAVTRTLLKRQIRNAVADGAGGMASGLWVVRLRAPFDRAEFPSAASDVLRLTARRELQQVLASAVERLPRR